MKKKSTRTLLLLLLGSTYPHHVWTFCHIRTTGSTTSRSTPQGVMRKLRTIGLDTNGDFNPTVSSLSFKCDLFYSQDGADISNTQQMRTTSRYYSKLKGKKQRRSGLTCFLFRSHNQRYCRAVTPSSSSNLFSTTADEQHQKDHCHENLEIGGYDINRRIQEDILQTIGVHVATRVNDLPNWLELEKEMKQKQEAKRYDHSIEMKCVATRRKMLEARLVSKEKSRVRKILHDSNNASQPPQISSQEAGGRLLNNLKVEPDRTDPKATPQTLHEARHVASRTKLLQKRIEYDAKALEKYRASLRWAAEAKQVHTREKLLQERLRLNLRKKTQEYGTDSVDSESILNYEYGEQAKEDPETVSSTNLSDIAAKYTLSPVKQIESAERRAETTRRKLLAARLGYERRASFKSSFQPKAISKVTPLKPLVSSIESLFDDKSVNMKKRQVATREKMLQWRLHHGQKPRTRDEEKVSLQFESRHVSTRQQMLQRRLKQENDANEREKSCVDDVPDECNNISMFSAPGVASRADDTAKDLFEKKILSKLTQSGGESIDDRRAFETRCVEARVKMMERRMLLKRKAATVTDKSKSMSAQEATASSAGNDPPPEFNLRVLPSDKPRTITADRMYFVTVVEDEAKVSPTNESKYYMANKPIPHTDPPNNIASAVNHKKIVMNSKSSESDWIKNGMESVFKEVKSGFNAVRDAVQEETLSDKSKSKSKSSDTNTASIFLTFGWVVLFSEHASSFIDVFQTIPFVFIIAKMLTGDYLREHPRDD